MNGAKDSDFWILDNRDSFVYNLAHRLFEVGGSSYVVRSDEISVAEIAARNPVGLIISPGPGRPETAGVSIEAIKRFHGEIPILGVCLGHQAIAVALGGSVEENGAPRHGKQSRIRCRKHPIFEGVDEFTDVGRYHSLGVIDLPVGFETIATVDGSEELMAIAHQGFVTIGFQFHPESILTPDGTEMLNNFVKICRSQENRILTAADSA